MDREAGKGVSASQKGAVGYNGGKQNMSQMSTKPVFRCKYCGKPVVIALLMTKTPDPESKLLFSLMPGLKTIAMCKDCKKKYNWYALQNRTQDFIAGKP